MEASLGPWRRRSLVRERGGGQTLAGGAGLREKPAGGSGWGRGRG